MRKNKREGSSVDFLASRDTILDKRREKLTVIAKELEAEGYHFKNSLDTFYISEPERLIHAEVDVESVSYLEGAEDDYRILFFARVNDQKIPQGFSWYFTLSHNGKPGQRGYFVHSKSFMLEAADQDTLKRIIRNGIRDTKSILSNYTDILQTYNPDGSNS